MSRTVQSRAAGVRGPDEQQYGDLPLRIAALVWGTWEVVYYSGYQP